MTKLILLPGGLICDAVGLTEDGDNRQILRMFLNTLIWRAAGVITDPAAYILNPQWDERGQWDEFDPGVMNALKGLVDQHPQDLVP